MTNVEDSIEMKEAKSLTKKGFIVIIIGTFVILALAIVTAYNPVKYLVDDPTRWWVVAGIGSVITVIGMGINTIGQNMQQSIITKEIHELLNKIAKNR